MKLASRARPILALLAAAGLLQGCVIQQPAPPPPSYPEPPPPRDEPPPPPRRPLPPPPRDEGSYRQMHGVRVPPDRVPPQGTCRVWYADLPPDRQPAAMSCGKARADARRGGGWVIWATGPESHRSGQVAAEDYGPHGLHGIPPDRLPPPGWCRLWIDGMAPDRQPAAGPCAVVARRQAAEGGRIIYMPASDLRR